MSWLRVKICCISSPEEARMAVKAGADALGLVAEMPSGPGVIMDTEIQRIAARVPRGIETFLLTSRTDPVSISAHFEATGVTTLQLVDWLGREKLDDLKTRQPEARIVQVLHIESSEQIEMAQEVEAYVDAFLLDSGRPNADVRELGGTGRTHDWAFSAQICAEVDIPVYLAGGLNASNVTSGVGSVNPHGVDLCSSVRTGGELDDGKLTEFFEAVQPFRISRPRAT